jgi:hypothetical protein
LQHYSQQLQHGISLDSKQQINREKKYSIARHLWLPPVILATQEAEIRRIVVQDSSRQVIVETLS